MNSLRAALLLAHAGAGFVGIVAFWSAALAGKGSRLHVRAGRAFFAAIAAVAATAILLAAGSRDPGRALFFAHLALLAFAGSAHGRWFRSTSAALAALQVLLVITGAATLGLGLARAAPAWAVLGATGVGLGLRSLRQQRSGVRLQRHVLGMISGGIALHMAVVVIAAGRLLPGGAPWFAWVLPGMLGTAALLAVGRRLPARGP